MKRMIGAIFLGITAIAFGASCGNNDEAPDARVSVHAGPDSGTAAPDAGAATPDAGTPAVDAGGADAT